MCAAYPALRASRLPACLPPCAQRRIRDVEDTLARTTLDRERLQQLERLAAAQEQELAKLQRLADDKSRAEADLMDKYMVLEEAHRPCKEELRQLEFQVSFLSKSKAISDDMVARMRTSVEELQAWGKSKVEHAGALAEQLDATNSSREAQALEMRQEMLHMRQRFNELEAARSRAESALSLEAVRLAETKAEVLELMAALKKSTQATLAERARLAQRSEECEALAGKCAAAEKRAGEWEAKAKRGEAELAAAQKQAAALAEQLAKAQGDSKGVMERLHEMILREARRQNMYVELLNRMKSCAGEAQALEVIRSGVLAQIMALASSGGSLENENSVYVEQAKLALTRFVEAFKKPRVEDDSKEARDLFTAVTAVQLVSNWTEKVQAVAENHGVAEVARRLMAESQREVNAWQLELGATYETGMRACARGWVWEKVCGLNRM